MRAAPARWRTLGLGCLLLSLLEPGDCAGGGGEPEDILVTSSGPPAATASAAPTAAAPRHHHLQQEEDDQDADTVTCYTCVNVSDNLVCNRFAIDRPCPSGEPFCHTLHIMDSRGRSVIVHKKCATSAECSPSTVGCLNIDSQRICVSCCDEMYCNESVPSNHTNARFSATRQEQLQRLVTSSPEQPALSAATSSASSRALMRLILMAFLSASTLML